MVLAVDFEVFLNAQAEAGGRRAQQRSWLNFKEGRKRTLAIWALALQGSCIRHVFVLH